MVSVIILNFNGVENNHLSDCLASLHQQLYPRVQIIVVDNASTDDSDIFIESCYPQITLIKNSQNVGFCKGNNIGFTEAIGSFIFFLNNDTIIAPDCIKELVAVAERCPEAGIFSPKLTRPLPSPPNPQTIDSAGLLLQRDLTLRDRGFSVIDAGQFEQPVFLFAACGAGLFIRLETAESVLVDGRLWDEDFAAYYEDGDLCWRAQNIGWRCLYVPTAVMVHKRGGASPAPFFHKPPAFQVHTIKNRYLMLIKNAPWSLLLRQLPFLLLREITIWGYLALHPSLFSATVHALWETVPSARRHRSMNNHRRKAADLFSITPSHEK